MKFNKRFYFLVLVICLTLAASTYSSPVPDNKDDKKRKSISIGKITAKEDDHKETFTITVEFSTKNALKEDKIDAKLEAKSDDGKVKDPSEKTVDADDKKVTFKVIIKEGKSAKFKVTLEGDKDKKFTTSKTFIVKRGEEECKEAKD